MTKTPKQDSLSRAVNALTNSAANPLSSAMAIMAEAARLENARYEDSLRRTKAPRPRITNNQSGHETGQYEPGTRRQLLELALTKTSEKCR